MSFEQYFSASPFALTADRGAARHWAGRPKTLRDIKRIIVGMRHRPDSTLDVIWASFGAGKTHTLYYLMNQLDERENVCGLVELTSQLKYFHDLYRLFALALPFDRIAQVILSHGSRQDAPSNLMRAAQLIAHGSPAERSLAVQWLCGEKRHLGTLKRVANITTRIDDDITATEILSALVRCLASSGGRMCMFIDEFQRIGKLPERTRTLITSSFRTIFSKSPKGFSTFLAITSLVEQTAMALVPNELRTIVGIRPSIDLPAFSGEEALQFVSDRFKYARPDGFSGDPFEPFTKDAVLRCIHFLATSEKMFLTPRLTLKILGDLFDEILVGPEVVQRPDGVIELLSQRYGERNVGSDAS